MDTKRAHRRLAAATAMVLAFQGLAALSALQGGAVAQTSPSPSGAPATPPSPAQPPATASGPGATLIPTPGDPSDVDDVVLPEKQVIIVSGSSTWEEGLKTIRGAFAKLKEEAAKDGLAVAGRPLSVFTETTDDNFRFDAMLPIATVPTPAPALPSGMRFGVTPSGKAYRFVHKAPYDDIDTTYETVTTYLDAKDIAAKDAFVEEYLDDIADPGDPNLSINIFVQPK